ncbi:MAG: pseudaminic acid cytidylyltransferase [Oscillospiraceae bacterium]|nr:pseudaminic acid cytidylyltransferase [Oscillospiraceae bacterium]
MRSIAIIPARGGSKRIPRKNIREFCGKPIIAYSIKAALDSGVFDEVMTSTDDAEIVEVAKYYGAKVPFLRSTETSTDMSMTVPVLTEVLDDYAKLGRVFSHVCCLYPCAPFVTPARLKEGMELLTNTDADSVFPIVKYSYPPQRSLVVKDGKAKLLIPENYNVRSQDFVPLYHDAGQFYCVKTSALQEQEKLYCKNSLPIILSESEVRDIDSEEDWKEAQIKYQIIKRGQIHDL